MSWVCTPSSTIVIAKINRAWLSGDCYKSLLEKLQHDRQVRLHVFHHGTKDWWMENQAEERETEEALT